MKNEILVLFIAIKCDEKFHHTLRASIITRKCDNKNYQTFSAMIITKKCDESFITLITRCSSHFQLQCKTKNESVCLTGAEPAANDPKWL